VVASLSIKRLNFGLIKSNPYYLCSVYNYLIGIINYLIGNLNEYKLIS
jgi:hypothetical protein